MVMELGVKHMGIFCKKVQQQLTPLEMKRVELRQDEIESHGRLENKVAKALSTYFAIQVLPDCPDKDAIKDAYEKAINDVRCEIGEHDRIVHDYKDVNNKCGNTWVECRNSHDIIINSVRRYFNRWN